MRHLIFVRMNFERLRHNAMNTLNLHFRLRLPSIGQATVLAALGLLSSISSLFGAAPVGDLQPYWPLNSQLPGGRFGQMVAAYSTNRFLVGVPWQNIVSNNSGTLTTYTNTGAAYLYNINSNFHAQFRNPDMRSGDVFGWSAAEVGTGQILIGAPFKDVVTPAPASLLLRDVGAAYLFNSSGTLLRTFSHPNASLGDQDAFGYSVCRLGTNRVLIGAPEDDFGTTNTTGRVYLFDLNGVLLKTIQNPFPQGNARFGHTITSMGTNRFVVGAPYSFPPSGGMGSTYLFDGAGNLLKTNHCPTIKDEYFGYSVTSIGTNGWFAVGSPVTDVETTTGFGTPTNYFNAGVVYLYDQNGSYVKAVPNPTPLHGEAFGWNLSRLGDTRFLVGLPYESTGAQETGAAYIYNDAGTRLATINNPAPNNSDSFGEAVAGVGQSYVVIGAPRDDTGGTDAGSAYAYEAPIVEFSVGFEIPKPANVLPDQLPLTGPVVEPSDAAIWNMPIGEPQNGKLFAVKTGPVLIRWPQSSTTNIVQGLNIWPTNSAAYQTHVLGSLPVALTGYSDTRVLHTEAGSGVNPDEIKFQHTFSATGSGRSLLLFANGNPQSDPIFFQLVNSIAWNDPVHLHTNAPAIIGDVLTNDFGYHNPACGGPLVMVPNSIYCADLNFYNRATRSGPIIPVNTEKPAIGSDDLAVAYYQKGIRLKNTSGANVPTELDWPWKPVRYTPQWPTNPPALVIASMRGTETIDPVIYKNWDLYFQNDPALPGFNPNDEHALRRPFDAGEAIFALRDDLETTNTSLPYVLIKYQDPQSNAGRMKVWRVVAQQTPYFFTYPGEAGKLVQAPLPLSSMQKCQESSGVSGPYWRDRKLDFWAKAAANNGGAANIVMRYFYAVQQGFYFPTNPPALGAHVPWLDLRAGTPGVPHDITYVISWPTVPELRVAETLVKPKYGLPDLSLQSSAEIIYQQSLALGQGSSVKLIDPTVERTANLAQLPADATTVNQAGKFYFPTLPPQLRSRLSYDPINGKLRFKGEFVQPALGEGYILLNVLTDREKAILLGLSNDPAFQIAINQLAVAAGSIEPVGNNTLGFDSLALTAGASQGLGYVTFATGNNTNLSGEAEPISLHILKVTCPVYTGEIKAILSANPFDEKITLRHSGDFAGRTDDYIFEWRTLPPVDGLPPAGDPSTWAIFTPVPANGQGAVDITIAGAGLMTLSDNWFICRYRSTDPNNPCGPGWSQWTAPQLAPGWIKRVTEGIGPFNQRMADYQNNTVNTIVSMISQAGTRWVGNVPLNQNAADSFGLIEIYETILKRGIDLSIEGNPSVNYPPANEALLLAAGRIADLYLLLGNEAYADASDPTIAFGTDDGVYGSEATSIHCFMNQTASLLEEELALLRGRDNSLLPNVQTYPVYNRLVWNFTGDINGGEVAYALNYNIQDQNGDAEGTIDENDAKLLYPQGHGDAWGHYLTGIKNYYRLLRSENFTWVPRIESVLVGGAPVSVDFLDERKFAHAAAARAKTGAEIVNLTYRQHYVEDPKGQYHGYPDANTNRAWGLAEWGTRAAQGALFDWVVGNAMLPSQDSNPAHVGIQKVDRTTVRELHDIASSLGDIQVQVDNADRGLNPIGLAKNVLPFDIDPAAITQGKTHFEQIFDRAAKALNNAIAVFNHANNATQLLRRQADSVQDFKNKVTDNEADLNNRLIEIFGYPYPEDIGPTGTYPSGYVGPDLYHYDYVDASELLGVTPPPAQNLDVQMKEYTVSTNGALGETSKTIKFNIAPHGLGLIKPAGWVGQRQAPGEIQMSRSDLIQARGRFEKLLTDYDNLLNNVEDQSVVLQAQFAANLEEINILDQGMQTQKSLLHAINEARAKQKFFNTAANTAKRLADAAAEHLPKVLGVASDATSVPRGVLMIMGTLASEVLSMQADKNAELEQEHFQAKELEQYLTNIKVTSLRNDVAFLHQLAQLEQMVRQEASLRLEILTLNEAMQQSSGRYLATLSRGLRLIEDRVRFRRQTAAQVQSYRYKDMAFRIFRNDALQKYRAQFDLAARYVYLAARAYDFETCLSQNDPRGPGEDFLTEIIRSRSLGLIQNGLPQTGSGQGDAGLADPMARMYLNWDLVLKGQLGFNNPKTETGRFSLRSEKFRVQPGFAGNAVWRESLSQLVVSNLLDMPEFQRYCIPFQPMLAVEPGLVIPFSTTVNFGQNFFGWPAGGGDNDYDSTHFATKIRSVGVWFANYNNLGGGMINTPRVYLVPVGNDILRSPTGGAGNIREWTILDQLLPVPFPLSGSALSNPNWIPMNDTLVGDLAEIRKFPRFRAYHDSGSFNENETINDSRLIGRSVWNTRWLLIIPAGTLHSDRNEGLQRFINGALTGNGDERDGNGVSDIKVFFQTYAYSGN
jgi:hypothetical protein